jgi:hypothetical protein
MIRVLRRDDVLRLLETFPAAQRYVAALPYLEIENEVLKDVGGVTCGEAIGAGGHKGRQLSDT